MLTTWCVMLCVQVMHNFLPSAVKFHYQVREAVMQVACVGCVWVVASLSAVPLSLPNISQSFLSMRYLGQYSGPLQQYTSQAGCRCLSSDASCLPF
jgi:hypothetical protein